MPMKYFVIFFVCVLSLCGCENKNRIRIPNAPAFMRLSLTTQYPTFRHTVNDTLVFVKPRVGYERQDRLGFGGLLLVVGIGEQGTDYFAYDLACPYEAKSSIRVYPNAEGVAQCRVCGSEYYLTDGWGRVSKPPSKWALKRYRVDYLDTMSGEEFLIVQH